MSHNYNNRSVQVTTPTVRKVHYFDSCPATFHSHQIHGRQSMSVG